MDWNSFVLGAGAVFGAVATLLFCVCQKRAGRQDAPKGASHDGSCRRATIAESDQAAARVIATALEARDARIAELEGALEECHEAMLMQLRREEESFHIRQPAARWIYDKAMERARALLAQRSTTNG